MPPRKYPPQKQSSSEETSELRNGKKRMPVESLPSKKRAGSGGGSGSDDNKPLVQYTVKELESDDSMSDSDKPIVKTSSKPIAIPAKRPPLAPRRNSIIKPLKPAHMIDEDEVEDETEDEDEEDEMEDEEDSDYDPSGSRSIVAPGTSFQISIGSFEDDNHMIPKRHNMKKEPAVVKKFVELVSKPLEDIGIDSQIDQFKAMNEEQQKQLLEALENRPTATDTGTQLMFRILTMKIPPVLQAMALAKYQALQTMDNSTSEYYKQRTWLDKFCSMPFGEYKDLPAVLDRDGPEICSGFLQNAKKCLDEAVYGQEEAKLQVLQWMANKVANPEARGKSLLLIGPAGVGKSSLVKEGIAKAIGWPFQFISMGGDSDASTYTGHQLVYESSHAGKIANSLMAAKSMSMVLMFDEVDKISTTPKGEEVQNLLIHLTDPVQNSEFEDKYLAGVPIDLSKVMFIFSANNISKIDKILLDRMNVIQMKGYGSKEKLYIAENYLLPAALKEVSLSERVSIPTDVLQHIISVYASDQSGVRELKRCIETVVQKINMLRMYNSKDLPFYIKDFTLPFIVRREHIELFLKKKNDGMDDGPPPGMYI